MPALEHAKEIAAIAHRGQFDLFGLPYAEHCRRVAEAVHGRSAKSVAWLHDIANRSTWVLPQLRAEGFGNRILAAVAALTQHDEESEEDLIRRAAENPLARVVKLADLRDNHFQVQQTGGDPRPYAEAIALCAASAGLVAGGMRQPISAAPRACLPAHMAARLAPGGCIGDIG